MSPGVPAAGCAAVALAAPVIAGVAACASCAEAGVAYKTEAIASWLAAAPRSERDEMLVISEIPLIRRPSDSREKQKRGGNPSPGLRNIRALLERNGGVAAIHTYSGSILLLW